MLCCSPSSFSTLDFNFSTQVSSPLLSYLSTYLIMLFTRPATISLEDRIAIAVVISNSTGPRGKGDWAKTCFPEMTAADHLNFTRDRVDRWLSMKGNKVLVAIVPFHDLANNRLGFTQLKPKPGTSVKDGVMVGILSYQLVDIKEDRSISLSWEVSAFREETEPKVDGVAHTALEAQVRAWKIKALRDYDLYYCKYASLPTAGGSTNFVSLCIITDCRSLIVADEWACLGIATKLCAELCADNCQQSGDRGPYPVFSDIDQREYSAISFLFTRLTIP